MNNLLRQFIKEVFVQEAEYPTTFDVKTFKEPIPDNELLKYKLSSNEKLTEPIKSRFERNIRTLKKLAGEGLGKKIGKGSSRIVYPIDNKTVLKLALNQKGIIQNREEVSLSKELNCVAKIFDYDPDFRWLESERALKEGVTQKFKTLTGLSFKKFMWLLQYYSTEEQIIGYLTKILPKKEVDFYLEFINSNELFIELKKAMEEFSLMEGDIARISSWGISQETGKPILIDYGFTSQTRNFYYGRF